MAAPEDIPAYVEKAAPLVEDELAELKALDPPEEDQETLDQMIAEEEKVLAAGEALATPPRKMTTSPSRKR